MYKYDSYDQAIVDARVDEFRDQVREGLVETVGDDLDDDVAADLLRRTSFQTSDADDGSDLAEAVRQAESDLGGSDADVRRLVYLSVPPSAIMAM